MHAFLLANNCTYLLQKHRSSDHMHKKGKGRAYKLLQSAAPQHAQGPVQGHPHARKSLTQVICKDLCLPCSALPCSVQGAVPGQQGHREAARLRAVCEPGIAMAAWQQAQEDQQPGGQLPPEDPLRAGNHTARYDGACTRQACMACALALSLDHPYLTLLQLSLQDNQICTLKGSLRTFTFLEQLDVSNNQVRRQAWLTMRQVLTHRTLAVEGRTLPPAFTLVDDAR